ncbi:MAG: hypothetical protein ACOYMN_01365 [Roseimicrobium sp.]
MQTDDDYQQPTRVLPIPQLLLVTVGTLVLAWVLMPTEQQMADRVLKDRYFEQLVSSLSAHGRMDEAKEAELRRMPGSRLAALARLFRLTPREQLHAIFRERAASYDLLTHGLVLAAVRYVDVVAPREALEILRPSLGTLPEAYQADVLDLLGTNAHAVSDPALAAECYRLACQTPAASWPTVERMVQTFRWQSRQHEAAQLLASWLKSQAAALETGVRQKARDLEYLLSLESGQPSLAFDNSLAELRALPEGQAPPREMVERAVQAATFSGRGGEVLPWVEKFVRTMPDWDIPWQALPTKHREQPSRFSELGAWWTRMARLADWGRLPDAAFGWHLRAAALGSVESLDRCLTLHAWLGRTEECAELLGALGAVPGREDLGAVLPRLLGVLGREKEALALFGKWLEQHADDHATRYAFACMLEDIGSDADAAKHLAELLRRQPDHSGALLKQSTMLVRQKRFADALALLAGASEAAHNEETLEAYAALAESLGEHEARLRALRLILGKVPSPAPAHYLAMADTALSTQEPQRVRGILEEGIRRFPDEVPLRLMQADWLARAQEYEAALAVLMHPSMAQRFEAVALLLNLTPQVEDAAAVLTFLGADVESRFVLAVPDRLHLAVLHHKAGHAGECARLLATVAETPENTRAIAQARFHCGDFAAAERLMLRCIKEPQGAKAGDWVFLGDIYERQGRAADAQRAYDQSLALLSADLLETAAR